MHVKKYSIKPVPVHYFYLAFRDPYKDTCRTFAQGLRHSYKNYTTLLASLKDKVLCRQESA